MEFRKMMKQFQTQPITRTEFSYEKVINEVREIYKNLQDKQVTILPLAKEIVDNVVNNYSEAIKLSHRFSENEYIIFHSVNVGILSILLGKEMQIDENLVDLCEAGLLHCVGRPCNNEKIIDLGDNFNRTEYINTTINLLKNVIDMSEVAKKIIIEHHKKIGKDILPFEFTDGELSLTEEILILVDSYFSVLHHPVMGKHKLPHSGFIRTLQSHYGNKQIHLKDDFSILLNAFVNIVGIYPIGTKVRLSTGEFAEVIEPVKNSPMRPIVKILLDASKKEVTKESIIDLSKTPLIYIKKEAKEIIR